MGCFEGFASMLYVCSAVLSLGQMITYVFDASADYEKYYWLAFYVTSSLIVLSDTKTFWRVTNSLGALSLAIVVLYCVGTSYLVDFEANVSEAQRAAFSASSASDSMSGGASDGTAATALHGGFSAFMLSYPLMAWFFVGVEVTPLALRYTNQTSKTVARGVIVCSVVLLVTALCVFFVAISQPPNVLGLASETFVLSHGFSSLFHTSVRAATALSLPATFATAHGFQFANALQNYNMALSGLFPRIFGYATKSGKPYMSVVVSSVLGYTTLLLMYTFYFQYLYLIFNVCILGSFVVYSTVCASCIVFKLRYADIKPDFHNPLGMYGAVYAMCVFTVGVVAAMFYQSDQYVATMIMGVIVCVGTLHYFLMAKQSQMFSKEEDRKVMVLFVAQGE